MKQPLTSSYPLYRATFLIGSIGGTPRIRRNETKEIQCETECELYYYL